MSALLNLLYPIQPQPKQAEIRALLICAQYQPSPAQVDCLRKLITDGFNWQHFTALAMDHRVYPLVYWNLNLHAADIASPAVLAELQAYFNHNLMFNLRMSTEAAQLFDALSEHGVKVMLFKGPMLAKAFHGSLAMREYKDIDILVQQKDLATARAVLHELNYHFIENDESINPKSARTHESYWQTQHNIEIELHWTLSTALIPFAVQGESRYWDKLSLYQIDGLTAYGLPADDQFLMLCMHGARHRWHRMKWLCDIREFVRVHPDFDWAALLKKATRFRLRTVVLLSFWLANRLLEMPLPVVINQALHHNQRVERLGHYVTAWVFDQQHTGGRAQVQAIVYYMLLQGWSIDRLSLLIYILRQRRSLQHNLMLLGVGSAVVLGVVLLCALIVNLVNS